VSLREADVGFDWGLTGARSLVADAGPGDLAVVVDVLSFTTTLTVAVERGILVHPYPWAQADAAAYAERRAAVLAVGRRAGLEPGAVSLSPQSFEGLVGVAAVVLPSPNGSTIAYALADAGLQVVGASLRNAAAVARLVSEREGRVLVVAAGERWPDGSLRPAVEDLWGAGAVLAGLTRGSLSPEAGAAAAAYDAVRGRLAEVLPASVSGRELAAAGFAGDVSLAAEEDVSVVVPLLTDDTFADAARDV
jgi:2-phosphosulfolactate phosphatase